MENYLIPLEPQIKLRVIPIWTTILVTYLSRWTNEQYRKMIFKTGLVSLGVYRNYQLARHVCGVTTHIQTFCVKSNSIFLYCLKKEFFDSYQEFIFHIILYNLYFIFYIIFIPFYMLLCVHYLKFCLSFNKKLLKISKIPIIINSFAKLHIA